MFKPETTMFTKFTTVDIFSQKIEIKEEPAENNEEFNEKPYCIEYKPLEIGYIQSDNKIKVKEESVEDYKDVDNWNSKNEGDGLAKCIENVDVGKYEFLSVGDCKMLSDNSPGICRDNFEIDIKEEEVKIYDPKVTCKSSMTIKNIGVSENDEYNSTNCANENDTSKKYFNCTYCDYKTTTNRLLKIHSKNKHSTDAKEFKCLQCYYETNYKESFNRHLTTHLLSNDKEFKCSQCIYQTNVKSYLNEHVKIKHNGVNKYKCKLCEYQTNRSANMKQHLSVHDDSKPYGCNVCNKQFKGKSKLKAHSIIHFEKKGFHCAHCDYKSYYKQYLISHLKRKHKFMITGID